ncbi:unnamed protein product [Rotaria magnacalcarata]
MHDSVSIKVKKEIKNSKDYFELSIQFKKTGMSVFDQVKNIIVEKIGASPENVTMKSSMADDLGCDDLDVTELIMAIEQEFKISIPDEYVENFKTVKDIVDYINKTKGEQ